MKNINDFLGQSVWKTVKCQRKIREKSGNFEVIKSGNPEMYLILDSFRKSHFVVKGYS